jgi:hypothetical protein
MRSHSSQERGVVAVTGAGAVPGQSVGRRADASPTVSVQGLINQQRKEMPMRESGEEQIGTVDVWGGSISRREEVHHAGSRASGAR